MIDKMNIAGKDCSEPTWLVFQETSCCKHATEGKGAFGSGGKHAGDCQAGLGAGVGELCWGTATPSSSPLTSWPPRYYP